MKKILLLNFMLIFIFSLVSCQEQGQTNEINKNIEIKQEMKIEKNIYEGLCIKDDSCCNSSLETIKKGNYKIIKNGEQCPDGFKSNMLKCISTLTWCEEDVDSLVAQTGSLENSSASLENGTGFTDKKEENNLVFNCEESKTLFKEYPFWFFEEDEDYIIWCNDCVNRNGKPFYSHDGGVFCNIKTNDAGKKCTDSLECEGYCTPEKHDGNSGLCTEYKELDDGCSPVLNNGEVSILCF